jgi:hypothetical protein
VLKREALHDVRVMSGNLCGAIVMCCVVAWPLDLVNIIWQKRLAKMRTPKYRLQRELILVLNKTISYGERLWDVFHKYM